MAVDPKIIVGGVVVGESVSDGEALMIGSGVANFRAITEADISDLGSYLTLTDITSGTLTARTGNIDLSGGSDGDVLTVQADGSLAIETPAGGGLAIGVAITSGAVNRVLFEDGSNQLAQSANFTWGTTNTGLALVSGAAATVPFRITAHASQSANLLEVNSSAGSGGNIISVQDDGYTQFNGTGSHVLMNGSIFRPLRLNASTPLNSTNAIELLNYGSTAPRFLEFTYHEASTATRASITFELDHNSGGYGRIQGRTVTGTDAAGRDLRIAGGCSTGAGTPGSLILEAAIADAGTGSTKNGLSTGFELTASTSALQLAFFGATPVIQQATTGTTTGFTAGSGTAVNDDSTFTGNSGTAAYTIGDIVLALKNYGLLAAS